MGQHFQEVSDTLNGYPIPDLISHILRDLYASGVDAYLVGGCVRDSYLNLFHGYSCEILDWDIAVCSGISTVLPILGTRDVKLSVYEAYGSVRFNIGSIKCEVTSFRVDLDYSDGRHPSSVVFSDNIMSDASRRDFSVNAIYWSRHSGVFDPFGGIDDIANKRFKVICGDGVDGVSKLCQDALRVLRAVNLKSRFNLDPDSYTDCAIRSSYAPARDLSVARKNLELVRLINSEFMVLALDSYMSVLNFIYETDFEPLRNNIAFINSPSNLDLERLSGIPARLLRCLPFLTPNMLEVLFLSKRSVRYSTLVSRCYGMFSSAFDLPSLKLAMFNFHVLNKQVSLLDMYDFSMVCVAINPLLTDDVRAHLLGLLRYLKNNGDCVHSSQLDFDILCLIDLGIDKKDFERAKDTILRFVVTGVIQNRHTDILDKLKTLGFNFC